MNQLANFPLLDHRCYVSMTMEFRCNLKCVHCMIEGTMDWLVPQTRDAFEELLALNAREQRWQGLILTGSEITLLKDLPELAGMARSAGFEHIRIQTHGMKLARKEYLAELIEAGVDEFFVSVAGADAATHDEITTVHGSFDKTLQGLENIDAYPHAVSITNSVVTRRSYQWLPHIVERLGHLRRLRQMEFWMYWPMRECDEKDLIPRYGDVLPYLKSAARRARELERAVEVKNFPECMLGDDADLLVNDQPQLYIDENFWPEFMRNGFYQCRYRLECNAAQCLGLSTAYATKYGWEEHLLSPLP
jgi:MoaA/NifB/PqqE/SkfB family radical SAM enzyme